MKRSTVWVSLLLLLLLTGCGNQGQSKTESKESSVYQVADVQNCRVTADQADIKTGAGDSFETVSTSNKGDEFNVLGQVGNWYVVQLDNNKVGCINSEAVQPIVKDGTPPSTPQTTQLPQTPQTPQQTQPQTDQAGASPSAQADDQETSMENQMVDLVNQERKKNNLPPLQVDPEVTRVARIKAQDMVDNNYFSHNSPTYGSPFDMLHSFGVEFLAAGENIAQNTSVVDAHNGLMASSGHRQNILNPNYTHIGIGIKPKGRNTYLFSQMFIGKTE